MSEPLFTLPAGGEFTVPTTEGQVFTYVCDPDFPAPPQDTCVDGLCCWYWDDVEGRTRWVSDELPCPLTHPERSSRYRDYLSALESLQRQHAEAGITPTILDEVGAAISAGEFMPAEVECHWSGVS